jgi:hypothetical protein
VRRAQRKQIMREMLRVRWIKFISSSWEMKRKNRVQKSNSLKKHINNKKKLVRYIEEPEEDDEPNTAVTESKKQTITTKKGHDDIIISEILRVCGYGTVEDLCRCFVVFVGV